MDAERQVHPESVASVSVRSQLTSLATFGPATLIWLGLLVWHAHDRRAAAEIEPPYVVAVFAVFWGVAMIVRSRRAVPHLSELPMRGSKAMWWFTAAGASCSSCSSWWSR